MVKIDSLEAQKRLGATSHHPRWAVAFKFPPERAITKVLNVTWQVGRTGVITPVAELEEVALSGSLVRRATLNNMDMIDKKDIRIGDTVVVHKAGEIIPEILERLEESREPGKTIAIEACSVCPCCGAPVIQYPGAVALRCENNECPAQIKERLRHFASRDCMDIKGLGSAIIDQIVEKGLVKAPSDLYRLSAEQIASLDRSGQKTGENLVASIEESKQRPMENLIPALGIPFIGRTAGKILAKRFGSIGSILAARGEDF